VYPSQDLIPSVDISWTPYSLYDLKFYYIQTNTSTARESTPDLQSVRIVLPFKEQKSADAVRKQLKDLGKLLNIDLSPVFISRKVGEDLKHKEIKLALINEQSVVYKF